MQFNLKFGLNWNRKTRWVIPKTTKLPESVPWNPLPSISEESSSVRRNPSKILLKYTTIYEYYWCRKEDFLLIHLSFTKNNNFRCIKLLEIRVNLNTKVFWIEFCASVRSWWRQRMLQQELKENRSPDLPDLWRSFWVRTSYPEPLRVFQPPGFCWGAGDRKCPHDSWRRVCSQTQLWRAVSSRWMYF